MPQVIVNLTEFFNKGKFMKRSLLVSLSLALYASHSYAVLMPGAVARNAYVFKKDYEDMFKDNEGKKIAARNRHGNTKIAAKANDGSILALLADDEFARRQMGAVTVAAASVTPTDVTGAGGNDTGGGNTGGGGSTGGGGGNTGGGGGSTGDHDNGHGNDDGHHDDSNPGNGGNSGNGGNGGSGGNGGDNGHGNSGDHDNGHGNESNNTDSSNPGQGGGNHGTGNNGNN
jgi:hypothetical protein